MKALEVDRITKSFGERLILDNISFTVESGHIHGLLGPNGAGKTTTMKVLTSLLGQESGTIKINGIIHPSFSPQSHPDLGFLLDEAPLYADMQVKEYLIFVGKLRSIGKSELKKNLDYCISKLNLEDVLHRSIENLSTGYKKRVAIAQALIHMPKILILDEPTSGLDPKSVKEMRDLILELKENHTIIISSHLLHEMSLVCDEVTIIVNGKIKETGTLADLRRKNAKEISVELLTKKEDLGFKDFLLSHSGVKEVTQESLNESVRFMIECDQSFSASAEIVKEAVKRDMDVLGLRVREYTLEDIFIKVTGA